MCNKLRDEKVSNICNFQIGKKLQLYAIKYGMK